MNWPAPRQLTMAFAAIFAVLTPAWMLWSDDKPTAATDQPPPTRLVPPGTLALQGAVFDAPLFNAGRSVEPEDGQSDGEQAADAPVTPPQLVGTILGRAGDSVALIKDASGEAHPLRIGEDVDGWRLIAIGNGTATVDRAGDRETLALDFSNKNQASPDAKGASAAPTVQASLAQPAVYSQKPFLSGMSGQ